MRAGFRDPLERLDSDSTIANSQKLFVVEVVERVAAVGSTDTAMLPRPRLRAQNANVLLNIIVGTLGRMLVIGTVSVLVGRSVEFIYAR